MKLAFTVKHPEKETIILAKDFFKFEKTDVFRKFSGGENCRETCFPLFFHTRDKSCFKLIPVHPRASLLETA